MFKLAHISDIHLGPLPDLSLRELASKRITGFVNWHRNRSRHLFTGTLDCLMADIEKRDPDHMAITGDLVNLASSREIATVTDWLEDARRPGQHLDRPGQSRCLCARRLREDDARLVSLYAGGWRTGRMA